MLITNIHHKQSLLSIKPSLYSILIAILVFLLTQKNKKPTEKHYFSYIYSVHCIPFYRFLLIAIFIF